MTRCDRDNDCYRGICRHHADLKDVLTCCCLSLVMVVGVDDREYINFCDGRPDVYYLHQRLHARPALLHLIKSNEYIDEKCTTEASASIAHE